MSNTDNPNTNNQDFHGKKVLITGASGFTGSVLVRKLVNLGADVRAIARPSSDLSPLSDLPIKWYRGQVYDRDLIKEATKDIDYIFHLAALYRETSADPNDYYLVHVESTKAMAEAVSSSPNFKRFVHLSTVGVHGHVESPPANEESPYNPGDDYQKTKLEAELWIRDYAEHKGLPLTVIRPAAIYGPGDRRLLKVFKLASFKFSPILGYGKCLYHLVHVEDLVDIIIEAANNTAALGQVFIAGAEQPVSLVEMMQVVCDVLRKKLRVLRIPAWPFFLVADLCELVCKPKVSKLIGLKPFIYRRRVAFFTKDRSFDTSKVRRLLGYKHKYTNSEGLKQTARWYLEHGWL